MAGDTQITLIGNLTGDPELRFTPSGAPVANFTVASTPRTFDRQSGEWKDGDAMFINCSVWRQYAENVAEVREKVGEVDVLVGTDEVPHGKPAPDSALLALKQLRVDAADTWYVGDALSDVAMSLAAGMRPLGVTTGACSEEQLLEAGAELVVSSPDEVAAVILG